MKKFFFIFVLYWLHSCNGTEKVNADTIKTSISEKQNAEKIERVIYESGGDKSGKNVHLVITKDSIIYRLTEGVTDEKTIVNLSLNNNNKDWEAFIDKIDLEDFEKGKPSKELIMDLPTTKIIIKTNKKEYSKTNIQNNTTWDYITKQVIDIKYSKLNNHLNLEK